MIYSLAAFIALVGLAETTFLTVKHLSGETFVCLTGSGCSGVLSSKYASFNGIPTAAFGALAYFLAFSASILAAFHYVFARRAFAFIVLIVFLFTCWFLYLQAFVLRTFCDYCLLSAAFSFALAGLAVAAPPASEPTRFKE